MDIIWFLVIISALFNCGLTQDSLKCGRSNRDGIGFFGDFPWVAQVEYQRVGNLSEKQVLCLGTLISRNYVLTSASCGVGTRSYKLVGLKLGGYSDDPDALDVKVKKVIVHQDFKRSDKNQANDIALFQLDEEVPLTDKIRPACLPHDKDTFKSYLTAVTWGRHFKGDSKTLQTVDLPVVTREQCESVYKTVNREIGDGVICAGGENGKDTCRGDTGGPLMDTEDDTVVGIVSYGPFPCGKEGWPGVYTNVSKYMSWIKTFLTI